MKTLVKTPRAAALAATLLLCACAGHSTSSVQPTRPAGGHGLQAFLGSYDASRDGTVTRAEFDAIREQRFRSGDKNGDGVLSEAEYVAEFEGRLKQQYFDEKRQPDEAYTRAIKQAHVRFGIVNRSRDGKFTQAEDKSMADKTFKSMDVNGDGAVTRDEPTRPAASGGDD